MKKCHIRPIGVCSWSIYNDFEKINILMESLRFEHIHLDLRPVCIEQSAEYMRQVRRQNWIISSTMIGFPQEDYSTLETIRKTGGIVPDQYWQRNRQLFVKAIEATKSLDVKYLSAHIGFIDHLQPADYQKLLDRVRSLADEALEREVVLLMETGQESADDLKRFLQDMNHPAVGVNFDPANMILYDRGDPIAAVKTLAPWIKHVHIKDAILTSTPGTWGAEVPWGPGQVGREHFLESLREIQYDGAVAVEREAGQSRFEDIRGAIESLIAFEG